MIIIVILQDKIFSHLNTFSKSGELSRPPTPIFSLISILSLSRDTKLELIFTITLNAFLSSSCLSVRPEVLEEIKNSIDIIIEISQGYFVIRIRN